MKTNPAGFSFSLTGPSDRSRAGSVLLGVLLGLSQCGVTLGQPAFNYPSFAEPVLSASVSINFAGLTANPFVGANTVNQLQLWDPATLTSTDLSLALFGIAPWPLPPQVDQGQLQTGFVSANISPTFFSTLQSGQVGLTALFTDTSDGWFAIDTIQLDIVTASGTLVAYYGSPADGFGIGLPPGGTLPGLLPGSLPPTGTGFDEGISGKSIYAIPEPGAAGLVALGLSLFLAWRRRTALGLRAQQAERFPQAESFPDDPPLRNAPAGAERPAVRRWLARGVALLVAAIFFGGVFTNSARAATLTRAQAAAALLSPGSGVNIDTNEMNVWSPFVDFGFGPGFEGLLPVGSLVDPAEEPIPGMIVGTASYFFFVDDEPTADFEHPVRFVLLDANNPSPTLGNGIVVTDQGWWPVVTPFGGSPADYFHTAAQIETAFPPGPANPQGLIAGITLEPGGLGGIAPRQPPPPPPPRSMSTNACGIVLFGSTDKPTFRNAAGLMQSDLVNHYGVPTNRIVRAGGNNAATSNDLYNAVTMICTQQPPCDKVFIRMASHGRQTPPGFLLADGIISASNLCHIFKRVAAKGVPICATINACYSGGLLDAQNWNFPAGSVIITAASSTNYTFSWNFFDGTNRFTNVVYYYSHSRCLNANPTNNPGLDRDGNGFIDDAEAYRWVTNQQPCYTRTDATNIMRYPAGRGTNYNPNPQIRTVGTDPALVNINVCNGTGTNKTDFHIVFQGNVTGGVAAAWRSTAQDRIGAPWAYASTNRSITYDSNRNETMVCWMDTNSPVLPGQYIHFGYWPPKGKGLRPVRQFWTPTPTTNPPARPDRVPTPRPSAGWDTNTAYVSIDFLNDGEGNGGLGGLLYLTATVLYSSDVIPLYNLNLGDPMVSSLPLVFTTNFTLAPDASLNFSLGVPASPGDLNPTLVLVSRAAWDTNANTTIMVSELPCRPGTIVGPTDQLHLLGPDPNGFLVGAPQSLTAMVEHRFFGLEGEPVTFSAVMGSLQFTSGAIGGGGTTSTVVTDASGTALVDFIGTAPGPALIQAAVNGLTAFQFLQVTVVTPLPVPAPKVAISTPVNGAVSLALTGEPQQSYEIQRSTDLAEWETLTTVTSSDAGQVQFTDRNAPRDRAFYRIVPR